tara:strand:+ start:43 stop:357 length:315 start_codon:yes stop_codon:yes gene_type:complete
MNKFDDREKSFEKKFAQDQEIQFKVYARRNKYLGEWVAKKLGKNKDETEQYIHELIKADFEEPGDQDVFRKIKRDFEKQKILIDDSEITKNMTSTLESAKKDFK